MSNFTPNQCPRCGAPLPLHAPEGLCPRCLAQLPLGTETEAPGEPKAAPLPPISPEELAPHFPQLEIFECLGRGGMGVVYKARQKSLNRLVALKLLAPERATDAEFAKRFTREAHALAALNHPHIVTIHDFGRAGGFYFLLMEFVDGVNLRQAMSANRFTPEQALAVVPPICEALQYAHEHGIVHRDIKPENLLLDKEGRVKIADFGIAKMLGEETSTGVGDSQPAGTPQYMAPEQKDHHHADHRADIYSLGVVLYEMLTGELPADKLQPPSSRVHGVTIDVRLDEIVLRALEKKPEMRFQTATDFRTQVETVSQERTGQTKATPANQSGSRNTPFAIFVVVYIAYVSFVWASTPPLSEKLAIHFDVDGHPNGWASHSGYLYFIYAFPLLLAGFNWLISRMAIRFPSFANIPRRDYWLAPERRKQTAALLFRWYLGLASILTVFMGGLHALVLQANQIQPPRLSIGLLLAWVIALLIGTTVWLIRFLVRMAETGDDAEFLEKSFQRSRVRRCLNVAGAGIAIAVLARAFLVEPFVVLGGGVSPEIPLGSRILVWKPSRVFAVGDLVTYTYNHERSVYVGRVVWDNEESLTVSRNDRPNEIIPKARVIGKVISVYWRGGAKPQKMPDAVAPAKPGYKLIKAFTPEDHTVSSDVRWSQDGNEPASLSLDRTEDGKLERELQEMLTSLKEEHPKVIAQRKLIAEQHHPSGPRVVRLYEVPNPEVEDCTVLYRAKLKTKALEGRAYLEMWCRFPGLGEAFSRGLDQTVSGSNDWVSCQIPFFLKKGEKPDLIRLNVVIEGDGEVRASDISLAAAPSLRAP